MIEAAIPDRLTMINHVAARYEGMGVASTMFRENLEGLDDEALKKRYGIELRRSEAAEAARLAHETFCAYQGVLEEYFPGQQIVISAQTGSFLIGSDDDELRAFANTLAKDDMVLCQRIGHP